MKELAPKEKPRNRRLNRFRSSDEGEGLSNELLREIAVMKQLQHPNLVQLKEIIREIEPPHTMFIIMEYVKLGNIMRISHTSASPAADNGSSKYVCPLTNGVMGEALASKCFRGLCSGMAYLHAHRVAHRDLKMENVLIDDKGTVRIADFGVSRVFGADDSVGHVFDTKGTWPYWSPQMCDQDINNVDEPYSAYKADVWAAGVCLWIFIYGTMPFWGQDMTELFLKINEGKAVRPHQVSKELDETLKAVLSMKEETRPEFKHILQNDFITFHNADIYPSDRETENKSPRFSVQVKRYP